MDLGKDAAYASQGGERSHIYGVSGLKRVKEDDDDDNDDNNDDGFVSIDSIPKKKFRNINESEYSERSETSPLNIADGSVDSVPKKKFRNINELGDYSERSETSPLNIANGSLDSVPKKKFRYRSDVLGDDSERSETSPLNIANGSVDSIPKKKLRYRSDMLGYNSERSQNSPLNVNVPGGFVDSIPKKKFRYSNDVLGDDSERSQNSLSECYRMLSRSGSNAGTHGGGVESSPSSPTLRPKEAASHRTQVFGIGFFPDSPIRDSSSGNNVDHNPLPINEHHAGNKRNGGVDQEFSLDDTAPTVRDGKKNGPHRINNRINNQINPFPDGAGGKDISRASLDDEDDRLVAADTEEPDNSTHSPSDFQNPDSDAQLDQPMPLPISSHGQQQTQTQQTPSYPNNYVLPQQMSQYALPGGAASMMSYNTLMYPHFPPALNGPMAMVMMQQQQGLPAGFGFPVPSNSEPPSIHSQDVDPPPQTQSQEPKPSKGIPLSMTCDRKNLSDYQFLIRAQLEIFEATQADVNDNNQGRKKKAILGQAGIRCRHCALVPLKKRGKSAVYFPTRLRNVYQACQNIASTHLCESCESIPKATREQLCILRDRKVCGVGGGKQYAADAARALGLTETAGNGLILTRKM